MNLSDSEILEKLTEAIAHHIPSTFGRDAQLASDPPIALHRRYSFMFRYWVNSPSGMRQPILVKIPHDSWMRSMQEAIESDHIREVSTSEFETMKTIANVVTASQHPMLDAIHPRAILPDYNALLMDELSIVMLKGSLSRLSITLGTSGSWQEFKRHLQLSGEWLKTIHGMTSTHQDMYLRDLGMLEKVENSLAFLEGSRGVPTGELRRLFVRLYDCIKDRPIPFASLHNDFQPGNIFITENGKLGALDPNWIESGPIFEDLASMLIYPRVRKPQVLTFGLQFRSNLQARYEGAVLHGYFKDDPVPYPILYFYCAADALEKWQDNELLLSSKNSGMMRNAAWLLKPWVRFYFQQLVKDYLERGYKQTRDNAEKRRL